MQKPQTRIDFETMISKAAIVANRNAFMTVKTTRIISDKNRNEFIRSLHPAASHTKH